MSSKTLTTMNLDELLAFSLIESNKHTNIKHSLRDLAVSACNISKKRHNTLKVEILRSVLSIIRFCNIHLYVCDKSRYTYYSAKLNFQLHATISKFKRMNIETPIKSIKLEFYTLIIELDKIKFEEEIHKEFNLAEPSNNKKNIEEIDNYFAELPKEETELFDFFGI